MKLNKKKKGFTLIELMAVIAIVAILAAVLVPTVSGYITRSKKTAIITQVRTVVNAIETHNATSTSPITTGDVSDVPDKVGADLLTAKDIDKLDEMTVEQAIAINGDADAIRKIEIESTTGTFSSYTEEKEEEGTK